MTRRYAEGLAGADLKEVALLFRIRFKFCA
jgi:hypothetical protein